MPRDGLHGPGDKEDVRNGTSSEVTTRWRTSETKIPLVVKDKRKHDKQTIAIVDNDMQVHCQYLDARRTLSTTTAPLLGEAREGMSATTVLIMMRRPSHITILRRLSRSGGGQAATTEASTGDPTLRALASHII